MKYYMRYNLQLFAKDGPGGEKTEPASQKKLSDARKEGNVAKSREIVNAVSLIVAFYFLKSTIGNIGTSIMRIYTLVYERIPTYASDTRDVTVSSAMLIWFTKAEGSSSSANGGEIRAIFSSSSGCT